MVDVLDAVEPQFVTAKNGGSETVVSRSESKTPGVLDIIRSSIEHAAHLPRRKNSGFDGRVLMAIATYAEKTTMEAWPGQKSIAALAYGLEIDDVTDSHIRSVRSSVDFLVREGCLEVTPHGHRLRSGKATNLYRLRFFDPVSDGE